MVSEELQNTQFLSPLQSLLLRLSLVHNIPFFRYHKNILIFSGSRVCQIACDTNVIVDNIFVHGSY